MALIGCPECKKKISDSVTSCPNCGYQITPEKLAEIKKKEKATQNKFASGCLVIILIIAVFYIIGLVTGSSGGSGSGSTTSHAVVENSAWDGSVFQVKSWLKDNAKDPDSIEFIEWSKVKPVGNGGFMVRAKYRGKNSFGGYTIENKVFFLDASGNVTSSIDYTK